MTLHSPIPSMLGMFVGRCGGESAPPALSFGHRQGHGHGGPPHHWGAPPPPPPQHGFPHQAFPGQPHPGFLEPPPAAGSTFPAPPQDASGATVAETPFACPNLSRGFCFGSLDAADLASDSTPFTYQNLSRGFRFGSRGWVGQGPVAMGAQAAGALRNLPPAALAFGACGNEVAALQSVLLALGYLQGGPWHLFKMHYGSRTCEAVHRYDYRVRRGRRPI